MKKIIAVFCSIAICFSLSVPALAEETSSMDKGNFWDYVAMYNFQQGNDTGGWIGAGFNLIGTKISDKLGGASCSYSDDNLHHGEIVRQIGAGRGGLATFECKCDYCGGTFTVTKTKDDLSAAYDEYVTTLPATGYDSSGGLLWSPEHDYIAVAWRVTPTQYYYCSHYPGKSSSTSPGFTANFDCSSNSVRISPLSGSSSFSKINVRFYYKGTAPVEGYYTRLSSPAINGYCSSSGSNTSLDKNWDGFNSPVFYALGDSVSLNIFTGREITDGSSGAFLLAQGFVPVYKVTPTASLSADTYNITTRPTSIIGGNYGIIGDNGQITRVEDNSTIINETNNTYYNPATGQTVPITGWSYDYSDRSYKVTLESGDTATITYGDENITIQEGDTVYNVYYLVDGTGNPPCEHDWQEGEATVPTCVRPGSASYVCSLCGQTKTESIPALGHNWQVKQTVTTQYDDTGQLTQQGYTIFECSTCHEQYKSADGTIPPGGGSGTDPGGEEKETIWDKLGKLFGAIGGGIIGMIEAAAGKVLDALISLVEQINEKLKTVIETVLSIFDELPLLFGGFLDFLAAVFPFLPAELMTILTFGILAVVFIGIIKAVRR